MVFESNLPFEPLSAIALFFGERIDTRSLPSHVATVGSVVSWGKRGKVILFRYGVVVFFDVEPDEQTELLEALLPHTLNAFDSPESEERQIQVSPRRRESIDGSQLYLNQVDNERLQVIAYILAKSVILAHYEKRLARVFDQIEPFASYLERTGVIEQPVKNLLQLIGRALLIRHTMVGRVEILEKPEVLWEHPELEVVYVRLEDEYELRDRNAALERKLELIGETAETILALVRAKRSLSLESYIVVLILVEISLSVYEIFFR